MKVTINNTHCEGNTFRDQRDCPLFRALREQHPTFEVEQVGGFRIEGKDGKFYSFDHQKWDNQVMEKIISGEVASITLTIKT